MKHFKYLFLPLICFVLLNSSCGTKNDSEPFQNPAYNNIFEEIYYDLGSMMYMTERVPHLSSYAENVYIFDPQGSVHKFMTVRYHLHSYQTYLQDSWYPDSFNCYDYSTMKEENRLVNITVSCDRKEQTLTFKKYMKLENEKIVEASYVYSVADQSMAYMSNQDKETAPDDFIYEILADWVIYNSSERGLSYSTQFSVDEWGEYEFSIREDPQ